MVKKYLTLFIFIFFICTSNVAYSANISIAKVFGGKIISAPKSIEIQTLESSGFICTVVGSTFDIKPVGNSPEGPYLTPISIGNSSPVVGRWILGKYNIIKTPITCTNPTGVVATVSAYQVTLFGTSKR